MSILIKGIDMPESCYTCKVRYACGAYFRYKDEHPFAIKSNGRMEGCPLVEVPMPHGRLIDTNSVVILPSGTGFELIMGTAEEKEYTIEQVITSCNTEVPTVIEAEE